MSALAHLREGLKKRHHVDVTLIDPRADFLFTPVLPEVASSGVSSRVAQLRLESLMDGDHFESVQDRALGFDFEKGVVSLSESELGFDHLILAVGTEPDLGALDDPESVALSWKTGEDARLLMRRVVDAFNRLSPDLDQAQLRSRLTFMVVGAGATGVELASELNAGVRRALLPRMPQSVREAFRVVLVEARQEVLHRHGSSVSGYAARRLGEAGVDLVLGQRVAALRQGVAVLESGEELYADHIVWAGGLRAPRWLEGVNLPLSAAGEILVDDDLAVQGLERVFAVGDAVHRVGAEPWPKTAFCAVQQGPIAANNVLMDMVGASLDPFEYIHWGDFIKLGEKDAVLDMGGVTLTGALAWTATRLAHVLLAPTTTKKVALFTEWTNNLLRGSELGRLPVS